MHDPDDSPPAGDRRSAARLRDDLRAMFVVHPRYSDVQHARVRDLGPGGACIFGGTLLAAGAEVSVGFFLPNDPDPLVAMARVVWSRSEPGGHAAGLAFAEGATAQRLARLRLSVYLEARFAAATG